MSEEASLLAAIRAAPADDLPRLVYADWLEEHGQSERAEFIRVQCEVERSEWAEHLRAGAYIGDPQLRDQRRRLFDLRQREGELFRAWRDEWFPPSSVTVVSVSEEVRAAVGARLVVRRGFVAEWSGTVAEWCGIGYEPGVGVGPQLARSHPLQVVTFTNREPSLHPSRDLYGWWVEFTSEGDESNLPVPLWSRLQGYVGQGSAATTTVKWYPSHSLALAAACAAAIAWALDEPTLV